MRGLQTQRLTIINLAWWISLAKIPFFLKKDLYSGNSTVEKYDKDEGRHYFLDICFTLVNRSLYGLLCSTDEALQQRGRYVSMKDKRWRRWPLHLSIGFKCWPMDYDVKKGFVYYTKLLVLRKEREVVKYYSKIAQ